VSEKDKLCTHRSTNQETFIPTFGTPTDLKQSFQLALINTLQQAFKEQYKIELLLCILNAQQYYF